MHFVRGSVLKSNDGVYAQETKTKEPTSVRGELDDYYYGENRDSFVSESTAHLKQLQSAGVEERREPHERRVKLAQSRQSERLDRLLHTSDDDNEGPTEFGPAAVTQHEFDFVEAQTQLRRKREIDKEKDISEFFTEKDRLRNCCSSTSSTDLSDKVVRAMLIDKRQRASMSTPRKVKATIRISKKSRVSVSNEKGEEAITPSVWETRSLAKACLTEQTSNKDKESKSSSTRPTDRSGSGRGLEGNRWDTIPTTWSCVWDDDEYYDDNHSRSSGRVPPSQNVKCSSTEGDTLAVKASCSGVDTVPESPQCVISLNEPLNETTSRKLENVE